MIADPQLRWVVTAALAAAAVLCGIGLVRHRGGAIGAVGHGIHVLMAVAMIDMAWPSAMVLPLPAGVVVFAAFTVFYVVATVARHYRPVNGLYHVAMMAAMSWMYAVMSDDIVSRSGGAMVMDHSTSGGDMGGMQMSAFSSPLSPRHVHGGGGMGGMSMADGLPGWAIALDWICVVVFAAATIWWLVRYFEARRRSGALAGDPAGALCQVLMAGSMSAMFAVMV